MLAFNLRGAFLCAQRAVRHFLDADRPGVIVNVSSVHQLIPKEMAAATAFLCSDEAAYITGQTLSIDGGLTLYPSFETTRSSE